MKRRKIKYANSQRKDIIRAIIGSVVFTAAHLHKSLIVFFFLNIVIHFGVFCLPSSLFHGAKSCALLKQISVALQSESQPTLQSTSHLEISICSGMYHRSGYHTEVCIEFVSDLSFHFPTCWIETQHSQIEFSQYGNPKPERLFPCEPTQSSL